MRSIFTCNIKIIYYIITIKNSISILLKFCFLELILTFNEFNLRNIIKILSTLI